MIQVSERRRRGLAVVLFVFLGMAPTVGDIGSCEQPPDDLDATTFFALKARTECNHCRECGLTTKRCDNACDHHSHANFVFPRLSPLGARWRGLPARAPPRLV